MYIHENPDWPRFRWNEEELARQLVDVRYRQGRLLGYMEALGFRQQSEAWLLSLTSEAIKTSEIEGEILNSEQVRSSIAKRLGLDRAALKPADRHVEGVVEMLLDATRAFAQPLTEERLLGWHAGLFPGGSSGPYRITVGAWRTDQTGPMQVVSRTGRTERVHFEAPAADRIEAEMRVFLRWFESSSAMDPVLKAGLAHLWFVTIHPFDDGNGRVARAITDLALARSENSARRFYSMSAQIREEREVYYEVLERTQRGTLEVSRWLEWFVGCLGRAVDGAQQMLAGVLTKARFWQQLAEVSLNERQRRVLNRLLDGFEGKLTTSTYARLTGCSQDTAHRDIRQLLELGLLVQGPAGGRSTSYSLIQPDLAS